MWIDGSTSLSRDRDGEVVPDDSWLVLLHAGEARTDVTLPGGEFGEKFVPVLDTATRRGTPASEAALPPGTTLTLPPRTLLLFRTPRAV
jgi:glycogen operon protein